MPLNVGDIAPDFELMNQDKQPIRLSDYRGKKKVMLLFYPMDFSPVCTDEHCSFAARIDAIRKDDNIVVFGINGDHVYSHAAFRKHYSIPYDLLSDPTRKTLKAYGMYAGEEPYNCSKRGTVVIDTDGRIAHYEEAAPKEPRSVDSLARLVDDAMGARDNEGGERITASR
jgi:peroxiredoxin